MDELIQTIGELSEQGASLSIIWNDFFSREMMLTRIYQHRAQKWKGLADFKYLRSFKKLNSEVTPGNFAPTNYSR